jgi:hypothetical protein
MCVVSAGIVVVSAGAGDTIEVSVDVVVVSELSVFEVPPPQAAAKAPSANTNKSFFIVFDLFL